jgi:UDP:flavonoid glycosyltransferase YjiC (YdhE family)
MGWSPHVAVAHYPEGAGHATRMLAIADELAARGAQVTLAGGGAGQRFVELNGYDAFEPTPVDYVDTYQDASRSTSGGSARRRRTPSSLTTCSPRWRPVVPVSRSTC